MAIDLQSYAAEVKFAVERFQKQHKSDPFWVTHWEEVLMEAWARANKTNVPVSGVEMF